MRGDEERATRESRDFPQHWGPPPGSRYSTERRAWIAFHVRADGASEDRLLTRAADARVRHLEAEAAGRVALAASYGREDLAARPEGSG